VAQRVATTKRRRRTKSVSRAAGRAQVFFLIKAMEFDQYLYKSFLMIKYGKGSVCVKKPAFIVLFKKNY
jgi:hypothetical protein